jgi:HSP20 family molecular chaperone IbpA
MSRLSGFNSPLLLGFDHFERILDQASKASAEGYPPYNIEQCGENELRITVAVAGFTMDDLNVTTEDNQLVIRGRHLEEDCERVYLHRGIAARQFQRSFILAEGIEITGASIDNGLLHIDLVRHVPEPEIRNIKIKSAGNKSNKPKTIDVDPDTKQGDLGRN